MGFPGIRHLVLATRYQGDEVRGDIARRTLVLNICLGNMPSSTRPARIPQEDAQTPNQDLHCLKLQVPRK